MAIVRWRPFDEMFTLRREMDRLFDRVFGEEFPSTPEGWGVWTPPINVSETGNNIVVTAEIPGLDTKDLEISIQDNVLTIKGEKTREKEDKDENYHRVERSYGTFTRQILLPTAVVTEKVTADSKKGILRITLPKAEEAKRRTVKINE